MEQYTYCVCKANWCINITIVAGYSSLTEYTENAISIFDNLWIEKSKNHYFKNDKIDEIDFDYFVKGLNVVKDYILKKREYEKTLITVYGVDFSVCDFQNEGLTAAIIEWAAETFKFKLLPIKVDFDKTKNRYIYDFSVTNK